MRVVGRWIRGYRGQIAIGQLQGVIAGGDADQPVKGGDAEAVAEVSPTRIALGRAIAQASRDGGGVIADYVVVLFPTATVKVEVGVPATVLPGWETSTSCSAAPAATVKATEVAGVKLPSEAVEDVVAGDVAVDGAKGGDTGGGGGGQVATQHRIIAAAVAQTDGDREVSLPTTLLKASSTLMVTFPKTVPAVALPGCVPNTSCVAGPATTLNGL